MRNTTDVQEEKKNVHEHLNRISLYYQSIHIIQLKFRNFNSPFQLFLPFKAQIRKKQPYLVSHHTREQPVAEISVKPTRRPSFHLSLPIREIPQLITGAAGLPAAASKHLAHNTGSVSHKGLHGNRGPSAPLWHYLCNVSSPNVPPTSQTAKANIPPIALPSAPFRRTVCARHLKDRARISSAFGVKR